MEVFCAYDALVPTGDIKPNPKNPNRHPAAQIALLAKVIQANGWRAPITVSTRSGYVVRGHGRLMAAIRAGFESCPVDYQDYESDEAETADLLADNRISELSANDGDALRVLLEELQAADYDTELAGYDAASLADLIQEDAAQTVDEVEEDDLPEEVEQRTQPGDVWRMGRHVLMCGDSTNAADVAILMGGVQADIVVTDPPYNVALGWHDRPSEQIQVERRGKDTAIDNDAFASGEQFQAFLVQAFTAARDVMRPGAAFYIWHAHGESEAFFTAARLSGLTVRQCLVWVKNVLVMGRSDYQWQHEPCLYGWKDGAAHTWCGSRTETTVIDDCDKRNPAAMTKADLVALCTELMGDLDAARNSTVWREKKPQKSEEHPTMKPVRLFARCVLNSSVQGQTVLDPFGGSGTTAIVCEQTGRAARLMELDPHYCDVILERWESFTGQKAERVSSYGE